MKRTFLSTRGIALPIPHLPSTAIACKRLLWFLSLLLVPVLSMAQAPAIDGDPSDWPAVFSNAGITVKNFTQDSVNSSNDDIFTNGSADIDPLADWAWTQSGANDKNDIHSAGIANIGTRVYFFADRFSNNGDAAIGIWIFKNNVSKMAGGSFSGVHVNGDILLISHFVNGGTVSDRKAFVWTNGVLVEDTTLTLADFAVAVNSTSIAAPAAWGYVPKTGPAGTYPANSFFEGYIDLASANLSLDICFSSFVIETRNSQSLNASLEDLVTGTFTNRPLSQTTSGSTLCSNSPTGVVTMNGSQTGVSYQLKNASNNSNVQAAQSGTGAAMMWTGLPAGSYYIVATNIGSNCETIIGNPTVVILNAVPAAPGVTGAARCGPGIVALGASGGGNCDSLIWFSDAGLTTRVNAGPTFSPNLSGTTSYWVICKSAAGCTSGATMVTGTVNSVPAAPTTTGASRCGPGIVALSASGSVNCDSLIWFSDAALTTRVNVGPGFSPNLSATTTYWVICKSVNGCVSTATTVIGTVNPIPAAPTTTGASRCGAGIVALSASGGANCDSLIWFSNAGLTTRVNVGAAFSPNISSTTTYWVVCKSVNGCISAATTVVGTVNPVPAAPTTTGASRCGAGIVALSASGGANCDSLIWFSDAGLTTRVNVGATFSPNISNTTTYWVVCKSVNGCVSAAATVIGTVNPIPAAPTTTGASRCGAGVVALSASGGANCDSLIWFSNAGLTTRVNVGPNFSPNISSTTTYWVICKSVNGCVSAATTVTGTVNPVPAAPSTTGASRCGPGMVILNASGGASCDSLIWFSNAGLTTRVHVGPSFTPNLSGTTTYWVVCKSASGCVSAAATVVGTINPIPAAPTTTGASRCDAGIVALSASGGANCDSLIWFSDAGLTTRVNVGPNFSPNVSSTTTYWVICKSAAGCSGNATTVTATVNPVPAAPQVPDVSRCGPGVLPIAASGGTNCDSLIWFSDAGLTTRVNVGASFSPNLSGTTTYWVVCKSTAGCSSSATAVVASILVCGNTHCTYTQGYYGNTNGNSCDGDTTWPNPVALINHLLTTDLVIGNGGKSILIPAGSGVTVNAVMPGSKTPKALVFAGQCTISTANGSCFKNNYLTIQGKINNVLLSQTITLALNARIHNGDLLGIPIDHGYLTTQETAGCGDSSEIVPCTPVDTLVISHFLMNENVVNYLTNFDAQPATVADLLQLANDVLGGALMPGQPGANGNTVPAYADVNAAVDAINRGFDKCRAYLGYNLPLCPVPLPKLVSGTAGGELSVYPNPGDGYFTVELPGASDDVKATVLDMNGRVVYEKAWKGAMDVLKLALDDLTTGVYLLQIDTGIETYRTKIMIRR